jgi:hypothetical protein
LVGSTLSVAKSNQSAAVRLPLVQAIGFIGHGFPPAEPKARALICELLKERRAATEGIVYGICSITAGAALLFAESCLQLGIPLRVLLPAPPETFRNDFDPSTWLRAEKVLTGAMSVAVTGNHQVRADGYYECGVETVQHSQLLIAWLDGEPSAEVDRTQEIVLLAREIGRPVISIYGRTGAVEDTGNQARGQMPDDSELQFLNALSDASAKPAEQPPIALARAWFQKIDENASQFAPQVRRMASIPIVFTAIAALASGAAARNADAFAWLAASAALGIFAAALPSVLRLRQRQILWVRTRSAAEVCRSVLALWAAPGLYEVIGPEIVPELSGMLRSLNFLKMVQGPVNGVSLEEFKAQYRRDRISTQIDYFSKQSRRSAHDGRNLKWAALLCIVLAVLTVAWWLGAKMAFAAGHSIPGRRWIPLLISGLFQIATISGALVVVHDCDRRQRRYGELSARLETWEKEFEALRTWASILNVVTRVERVLLVEMLEWRSLIGNTTLPRK